MHPSRSSFLLTVALVALPCIAPRAQDPAAPKPPDKEVAEMIDRLKEVVADKKFTRDGEGVDLIDKLLQKLNAGLGDKDQKDVAKALEHVLSSGKVRPPDNTKLYVASAAALAYCGDNGAKALRKAFDDKRFPEKKDWVPLREQLLRNIGKTKDESMVKFLLETARRSHEAALQAAAGEALGNFDESKESIRKDIVGELLITYGELDELGGQLGPGNIEAQNARDRLAAISDKWNTTLSKLTRQSFARFREWQAWYNKNKNAAWK